MRKKFLIFCETWLLEPLTCLFDDKGSPEKVRFSAGSVEWLDEELKSCVMENDDVQRNAAVVRGYCEKGLCSARQREGLKWMRLFSGSPISEPCLYEKVEVQAPSVLWLTSQKGVVVGFVRKVERMSGCWMAMSQQQKNKSRGMSVALLHQTAAEGKGRVPVGELESGWKLPKKAGSHPARKPCRALPVAIETRFSMHDANARKSFYGALVRASTALIERRIYIPGASARAEQPQQARAAPMLVVSVCFAFPAAPRYRCFYQAYICPTKSLILWIYQLEKYTSWPTVLRSLHLTSHGAQGLAWVIPPKRSKSRRLILPSNLRRRHYSVHCMWSRLSSKHSFET